MLLVLAWFLFLTSNYLLTGQQTSSGDISEWISCSFICFKFLLCVFAQAFSPINESRHVFRRFQSIILFVVPVLLISCQIIQLSSQRRVSEISYHWCRRLFNFPYIHCFWANNSRVCFLCFVWLIFQKQSQYFSLCDRSLKRCDMQIWWRNEFC